MANPKHLTILEQGVEKWNQWRLENPEIEPDLSEANLVKANLNGVDLSKANLRATIAIDASLAFSNLSRAKLVEADLSKAELVAVLFNEADLNRATLNNAKLKGARFYGAKLGKANLREADLSGAKLSGANLFEANLYKANLSEAELNGTKLCGVNLTEATLTKAQLIKAKLNRAELNGATISEANLNKADLSEANLVKANLSGANLSEAICENANFSFALLGAARLLNASLNRAILNGSCLWETQRGGWLIRGVVCESVYWDRKREKIIEYGPGDFERLYSEKTRLQIKYPNGITPLEIVTLPALIQHLETSHPVCKLRFESIYDASGGALVSIIIDDTSEISFEKMEQLRVSIQSEAEHEVQRFRIALKEKEELILRLEGQVQAFQWTYKELLLNQKQNLLFITGGFEMSDTYNVGQAGAVGPTAHAHDMTFNQVGGLIEKSMDLGQLSIELSKLRQAMTQDANDAEHYIAVGEIAKAEQAAKSKDTSKLTESLKTAGKWSLDVATKIGVSLASEAIKHSMGMK